MWEKGSGMFKILRARKLKKLKLKKLGSLIGALGVLSAALVSADPSEANAQAAPHVISGLVIKVSDGDTIHVKPPGQDKLKIRMLNMDTPETQLPAKGGMASQGYWGDAATQQLRDLLPIGSRVDLIVYGSDMYGRTLARVIHQGYDVNLEMTRSGWGAPYVLCEGYECDGSFWERHEVLRYLHACEEARHNGRGIYNPHRPIPELPFEFRLRIQQREPNKYVGDVYTRRLVEPHRYAEIDVCRAVFFPRIEDAFKQGFRF